MPIKISTQAAGFQPAATLTMLLATQAGPYQLKPPNTKEEKFEDVIKDAQTATVLVLVYGCVESALCADSFEPPACVWSFGAAGRLDTTYFRLASTLAPPKRTVLVLGYSDTNCTDFHGKEFNPC